MASRSQSMSGQGALTLFANDHRKVQQMFNAFEGMKDEDEADERKSGLVRQICDEFMVHSQIKEEIFYPAYARPSMAPS